MIESMLILLSNPTFSLVTKALLFSSKTQSKGISSTIIEEELSQFDFTELTDKVAKSCSKIPG